MVGGAWTNGPRITADPGSSVSGGRKGIGPWEAGAGWHFGSSSQDEQTGLVSWPRSPNMGRDWSGWTLSPGPHGDRTERRVGRTRSVCAEVSVSRGDTQKFIISWPTFRHAQHCFRVFPGPPGSAWGPRKSARRGSWPAELGPPDWDKS